MKACNYCSLPCADDAIAPSGLCFGCDENFARREPGDRPPEAKNAGIGLRGGHLTKPRLKLYDITCGSCVHYEEYGDTSFMKCGHPKIGRLMVVSSGDQPIYCPGGVKAPATVAP